MLTSDQRERLALLKTLAQCEKKEAKEALENNEWDTSMAFEWMKYHKDHPEASLDEFHALYEKSKEEAYVLPADRYDVVTSSKKVATNRQARRAMKKQEKKNKAKK